MYTFTPKNILKAKSFQKSTLAIACSLAVAAGPVSASSVFEGKVTNATSKVFFEGAKVTLKEINRSATTRRDGSFFFSDVPAGTYTLEVIYLGTKNTEETITIGSEGSYSKTINIGSGDEFVENIVVYGQKAGYANALNRQKNADNFKSIVSADAIGQLPDQNVAEALQRLPGMFVQRDQGEGRFVGIRGIDPNLNNVSINGIGVPSPEAGVRSVAMDVIPSELVQSLEVSKTVTPDMDASAIGGAIEVKSLSAFDKKGRSYSVKVKGSHNDLVDELSPKLSGSYTNIVDLGGTSRLGIATAVSWFERKFGSHSMETDGGWSTIEVEDQATGDDIEVFGAEEIEQRLYEITRERTGLALNLDLRTSEDDQYYFRTLYSEFSDDEYRLKNEYKFDSGELDASSHNNSFAQYTDADMDRDTKDRFEEQEILSLVFGGENRLDKWLVEYNVGYSKSSEREPGRTDVDFEGEGFDIGYTSSGPEPQLTRSADAHDLANFELDEIVYENNLSEDETTSFRIDLTRDFTLNKANGAFKFGVKYQSREKFNDIDITIYDGGFNDATAADFASGEQEYNLGSFGPGISRGSLNRFVTNNRQSFEINQNESEVDSNGQSYESKEDITAAYLMATIDYNAWHIVTGVRFESTQFDTSGYRVSLDVVETTVEESETVTTTRWEGSKDYDHFLPNLNVRYTFNEKLQARFAYTNTIARPSFRDSAAFQLIESETEEDNGEIEVEREAEVGNPELDAFESSNLDFSIEYYPGNVGVVSAGVFYKDIDNFIILQQVQDNGQWDGFDEVLQHVNGGSADLTGLEVAWKKTFDFGLLFNINGTFIDADDQLPSQSDTVGNIVIGYENIHLSARLSATYKTENFQYEENDARVYEDTHTQLDFSGKYNINESITVFFNAVNITDEPYYFYHGSSRYNYQFEEYGRTFEFGFTLKSL